ncbi:MAG TPA: PIN domain-containing protein [Acetobacteraceae bacterium]|nr:PIN domain-containing protein [Acetobacteraceae bacterium]
MDSRREVERFAARVAVLAFDDRAAGHAAEIRADLERRGQSIGAYDLPIARHARSQGLVVVAGNLREFAAVDGLRCEDWFEQKSRE